MASRINFVTIFGDLYQNKIWGICNNLNQFTYLSSASGPNDDVIRMASKVLLMHIISNLIQSNSYVGISCWNQVLSLFD